MRRTARLAAAACLSLAALLPAGGRAVDVADGQLTVHGDGQWAYERSSGDNGYDMASPEGNYDTAMFDLVITARPAEDLVVSAQLGFEPEGPALEWGFAEWRFSEKLRLRMGKVQQPFGNLNELRFAGTTRPFFHLPWSAYGPGNVVGVAYMGLGATGQTVSEGGWTLGYDLYGGAVALDELEPHAALRRPGSARAGEVVAVEMQQVRDLVGGRISLSAPNDLTARLSAYAGRLLHGDQTEGFAAYGASLQYRGERLWLSAEAFGSREDDGEATWTAYATAAWSVTEHLQVAAQYEWMRTDWAGSPASPLLRHDGVGLAVAWWVNPGLAFKACWHQLEGNRLAFPADATPQGLLDAPPGATTGVLTVGTQFAF